MKTDLSKRIEEKADQDNLPADHPLRLAARDFVEVSAGYFADPQTCSIKKFMGTWARTRRLWCEYSGESLI